MNNQFRIYDTCLTYLDKKEKDKGIDGKYQHYGILYQILNMLKREGFFVEKDQEISKIIRKNYFAGKRKDLEFKAERYPAGFRITFFQNVYYENKSGGYYDFYKYEKMPYLIKLQYKKYMEKIKQMLKTLDPTVEDHTTVIYKLAEDQIKARYVSSWWQEQKDMNFSLSDLDGIHPKYNSTDRDGKSIKNGDIKYFRDFNGYLRRGRIYHDINNIWNVIVDKYTVDKVACFELFDLSPEDFRGRKKIDTRKRTTVSEDKKRAENLCSYLNESDKAKLKKAWQKAGGCKTMPWWKWCLENIKISCNVATVYSLNTRKEN